MNATTGVLGSFAYSPTNGTILNAGTDTLSVIFTPTDTVDYASVTGTVSIVVNPASLTVTAASTNRLVGAPNPVFSGIITGVTNGDNITAAYGCSATTSSPVGAYPIVPSLVDSNNLQTNYAVTLVNGTLTVEPLPIILTPPQSQTVPVGANVTFSVTANTPLTLPSVSSGTLQLWLRADAGVVTNSAGQVSQWQDQSGNANHASQTTTSLQPTLVSAAGLGGEAAVRFNGIQDNVNGSYLSGTGLVGVPNAMTVFVLYNAFSTPGSQDMLWEIGVPGQGSAGRNAWINNGDLFFTFWANDYGTSFVVPVNIYRIRTDRLDTNLDTLDIFDTTANITNHFTISTSGAGTPGAGYYVGGFNSSLPAVGDSRNFDGDIAELICYQGYLSETDRQAVTGYLEQKYYQNGSPSSLSYQWQFNGTNLTNNAQITGSQSSVLTLTSVTFSNAGTYQVVVSNTYGSTNAVATLTVTQATPIITWANPAPIMYGTALSSNQLNATANVLGSFAYSPAAGTVFNPGTNTLSVIFTPTDTVDYTSVTDTVSLVVLPITPIVTWPNPASITYGTPLSSNQLNATANAPGSFAYNLTCGTVLNVGTYLLSVVFAPSNAVGYLSVTDTVSLVVLPAPLTVAVANMSRLYDTTNPVFTGTITGVTNGDNITAAYSCSATTSSPVGAYPIVPSLVDPNNLQTNYTVTLVNGTLTVGLLPIILTPPQSQTVPVGANVTFSVTANGTPLLSISSGTLQLWLRADAGVVTNSAGLVSQWQDQSGNANHATQSTTSLQPTLVSAAGLGGEAAVRFNGIQNYMNGTGLVGVPNAMTVFMLYNAFSTANNQKMLWEIGVPAQNDVGRNAWINNGDLFFTFWGNDYNIPFVVPTNTYRIRTDRLDTNLDTLNVFDTTATSATNFTISVNGALTPGAGYYVGGFNPSLSATSWSFNGDIAELICYSGYLSETDRMAVTDYLEQKYYQNVYSGNLGYQWLFNGTNLTDNAEITGSQSNILTLSSVTFTNSGTYQVVVSNLFGSTNALATLTVTQATPIITWANPTSIMYGTALSSNQLNATANVPGNFIYNPAAGTVLNAGTNTLSVIFTPTDTVDYASVTDTMSLIVQGTPVISWTNPASIAYGSPLTSNQLNAAANVPGNFAYNPATGTVLSTGANTLSVIFTPTDTIDYTSVTDTVSVMVLPAPLTVTAANASRAYGQINPVFTGTITGVQNGDNITATYSCSATTNSPVGTYAITPSLVDPNDLETNYAVTNNNGTLTITIAIPILAWTNPAPIIYGAPLTSNQLNATTGVLGSFAYSPTNGTVLNAGTDTLSVIFTPTDTVDYASVTASVSLVVLPASLTVIAASTNRPVGAPNPVFSGTIAGVTNGDNITATFSCSATTNSPEGAYAITPALVDPNNRQTNYMVDLVNGTLTVEPVPIIVTQPQSQMGLVGTNVTFSVAATNTPALPSVNSGTLQLWLRADAGVVTNSAGQVSQWQDQSGNANHASQSTTSLQPTLVSAAGLGGEAAVRFNGIQDNVNGSYLSGTGQIGVPNAMTVFMLYNAFSTANNQNMMWEIGVPGQGSAGRNAWINAGDLLFTFWANDYFLSFVVPTDTYRIRTDRLDTNLDTLDIFDTTAAITNHFTISTSGAGTPGAGYYVGGFNSSVSGVGSSRNFNGDIAELICYQGYLSETDRQAVTGYLEQKYYQNGSPSSLSYQWQFNGTNIANATNSTLSLPSVSLAQAGSYQAVVTGTYGSVTSNPALLDVRPILVSTNGGSLTGTNYTFVGPTTVSFVTGFTNGSMYYTLDGSQPSFLTSFYQSLFTIEQSSLLRAVAYSADFSQYGEMPPIAITIIPVYGITYIPSPGGSVSVSPSNSVYETGSQVNLQATPNPGWTFLNWQGDCSGGNTNFTLTVNSPKIVQAVFGTSLSETVAGNGTLAVNPSSSLYPYGATVRLTANPASGYAFGTWGNAAAGIGTNPLYFTITNAAPVISALFVPLSGNQVSLTIQTSGNGQVQANPLANAYALNSTVALTAFPDAGQKFLGWSGNASGGSTNYSLTMNQSQTVIAMFSHAPSLSVKAPLNGLFYSGFRLTITSDFGAVCDLEASTNLSSWYSVATVTNTYGASQFTDPEATTNNATFYRSILSP